MKLQYFFAYVTYRSIGPGVLFRIYICILCNMYTCHFNKKFTYLIYLLVYNEWEHFLFIFLPKKVLTEHFPHLLYTVDLYLMQRMGKFSKTKQTKWPIFSQLLWIFTVHVNTTGGDKNLVILFPNKMLIGFFFQPIILYIVDLYWSKWGHFLSFFS